MDAGVVRPALRAPAGPGWCGLDVAGRQFRENGVRPRDRAEEGAVVEVVPHVRGPDVAGGALLAGLADRFPRRRIMVACELARAALVAVMALPGQPIALLVVMLAARFS